MSNEIAARIFGYGSPQYHSIVQGLRKLVFDEFLTCPIPGLVFTFVWHLEDSYGVAYFKSLQRQGYRITLVELQASLETLLSRNRDAERAQHKPSKRDINEAEANLLAAVSMHTLNTECPDHPIILAFPRHLCFDTTQMKPSSVAAVVAETFFPEIA